MSRADTCRRLLTGILVLLGLTAVSLPAQGTSPHAAVRILHYDFTIDVPDTGNVILGRAAITAIRLSQTDHFALDLVGLRVDSVLVNGAPVSFTRDPESLSVPLRPMMSGIADTLLVVVRYGGAVKDGLIIHADQEGRWYAFGDNWPTRARFWLPTIDRPDEKATVSWNVIAPSDRAVVANGAFVSEQVLPSTSGSDTKSRKLSRWSTARPIPPYLMVIGVGPMIVRDLGLTAKGLSEFPPGVRQSVYAQPELADYLPGPFVNAGPIVELFARLVAPFPYEKLAHVESFTRYGGMENASAIFYADGYFRHRSTDPGIIAHETAHQWFGDAVTPARWGDLWLSEGFASYFEQLWMEHTAGTKVFREGMSKLRSEIVGSRVTSERPVIDTLQTVLMRLLNTNSYQKGAWVLHMIRSMIGDTAFFSGVRKYYAHHRHANATSDDLCMEFSQAAHKDLRWFFDQWLRRPGFPELTIGWSYNAAQETITLNVTQGARFALYRFPLRVEIVDSEGKRHLVRVEVPARPSVTLNLPTPVGTKPTQLVFDPLVELLATVKTE